MTEEIEQAIDDLFRAAYMLYKHDMEQAADPESSKQVVKRARNLLDYMYRCERFIREEAKKCGPTT